MLHLAFNENLPLNNQVWIQVTRKVQMSDFEAFGGKPMITAITKSFYDKVYADPWLSQFFDSVPQELIENQQIDFMCDVLGGPKNYAGKVVPKAHAHIHITEEVFAAREKLLLEAMAEVNAPEGLIQKWTKIDNAFKAALIKKSKDDCVRRYADEPIIDIPPPASYKKAS